MHSPFFPWHYSACNYLFFTQRIARTRDYVCLCSATRNCPQHDLTGPTVHKIWVRTRSQSHGFPHFSRCFHPWNMRSKKSQKLWIHVQYCTSFLVAYRPVFWRHNPAWQASLHLSCSRTSLLGWLLCALHWVHIGLCAVLLIHDIFVVVFTISNSLFFLPCLSVSLRHLTFSSTDKQPSSSVWPNYFPHPLFLFQITVLSGKCFPLSTCLRGAACWRRSSCSRPGRDSRSEACWSCIAAVSSMWV